MTKRIPYGSYENEVEGLLYDIPAADTVLSPINLVKVSRLGDNERIPQLVADPGANSSHQTHLRTPVRKTHFPA